MKSRSDDCLPNDAGKPGRAADCRKGPRFRAAVRRLQPAPVRAARLATLGREAARWAWYAVEVAPQREFLVQRLLEGRGVLVFVATRVVWRRPNGQTRRKRRVVLPALPRFVLVGVVDEAGLFAALRGVPHVSGVVGVGGRPWPVGAAGLMWMAQRSSEAPAVEQFMASRLEFGVGDVVRISAGAMEGVRARVLALDGARARVLAPLFGGEIEAVCETASLEVVNG